MLNFFYVDNHQFIKLFQEYVFFINIVMIILHYVFYVLMLIFMTIKNNLKP